MAGIWDRINKNAGENVDTIGTDLLEVILVGYHTGFIANKALALSKINEQQRDPLDFDAQSDLNAIATNYDNISGGNATQVLVAKLDYLQTIKTAIVGAAAGILTETQFRNVLGI